MGYSSGYFVHVRGQRACFFKDNLRVELDEGEPVFVEINFNFGRKGLGGMAGHRKYELEAVRKWRERRLRELTSD